MLYVVPIIVPIIVPKSSWFLLFPILIVSKLCQYKYENIRGVFKLSQTLLNIVSFISQLILVDRNRTREETKMKIELLGPAFSPWFWNIMTVESRGKMKKVGYKKLYLTASWNLSVLMLPSKLTPKLKAPPYYSYNVTPTSLSLPPKL